MAGNAATERRRIESEEDLVRQDVQRMKEDLAALRADFRALAGDAFSAGKSRAAGAARSTAEQGREAVDTIGDKVREHPLRSLGFAFAGGALAGLLLRRHR